MKYPIGKKQVKVFIMKKFVIFILAMFGLMLGMLAMMVIEYQISYNKWKSSYTGKIVTNSEKEREELRVIMTEVFEEKMNKHKIK